MEQKNEDERNEMDILLEWLSPDSEKSAALFLDLRRRLVFIFRFFEDPEDLAGEVVMRALNNIKKGKVELSGKAEHYILKIAFFVKKEQVRKKIVFQIDETINHLPTSMCENSFPEELYRIIEECFGALDEDEREIFLAYTFSPEDTPEKQHRQNVAEKWNITIGHMRVIIFRVKNKLRDCAMKKLAEE